MKEEEHMIKGLRILLIYTSWIGITAGFRYFLRLFDYQVINIWIWAAVRMTLLLAITYLYIRIYEKKSFAEGFNFHFRHIGKNIFWAVIFVVMAGGILWIYQNFIVKSIIGSEVIASSAPEKTLTPSLFDRISEFFYIFYEGLVEVLIFIGFLIDRLAKKYGWVTAIIIGNIGFALWHFNYWNSGIMKGTLMIIFVLLAGIFDSLIYFKTRNSLGPAIGHTLGDLPHAIRFLLGAH